MFTLTDYDSLCSSASFPIYLSSFLSSYPVNDCVSLIVLNKFIPSSISVRYFFSYQNYRHQKYYLNTLSITIKISDTFYLLHSHIQSIKCSFITLFTRNSVLITSVLLYKTFKTEILEGHPSMCCKTLPTFFFLIPVLQQPFYGLFFLDLKLCWIDIKLYSPTYQLYSLHLHSLPCLSHS